MRKGSEPEMMFEGIEPSEQFIGIADRLDKLREIKTRPLRRTIEERQTVRKGTIVREPNFG
jgi:hypothetical protein